MTFLIGMVGNQAASGSSRKLWFGIQMAWKPLPPPAPTLTPMSPQGLKGLNPLHHHPPHLLPAKEGGIWITHVIALPACRGSEPVHQRLALFPFHLLFITTGAEIPSLRMAVKAAIWLFAFGLLDITNNPPSCFIYRRSFLSAVLFYVLPVTVAVVVLGGNASEGFTICIKTWMNIHVRRGKPSYVGRLWPCLAAMPGQGGVRGEAAAGPPRYLPPTLVVTGGVRPFCVAVDH